MKLKYKLFFSIIIIGVFALTLGLIGVYHFTKIETINVELANDSKNVEYISQTIENDLLELVRLTTTLANTNVVKDALISSNNDFSSLSVSEREQTIFDLNNTWMNTSDVNDPFIKERMENDAALYLVSQENKYSDLYGEIFLTNEYGVMISTTGKLTTLAHHDKYWWEGAFNDGEGIVYIDDRGYDDSVAGYVLGIVVPVYDDENNIIGILKSNFNIAYIFEDSVTNFHNLNLEGEYLVVRTLGLIVNGKDIEPLSESVPEYLLSYLSQKTIISKEINFENNDKFMAISPINLTFDSNDIEFGGSCESIDHLGGNLGEGWSVVYLVDSSIVFNDINHTTISNITSGIIILLLMGLSGLFIGETLSKPFINLNNYITEVGKGNLIKKDFKISNDEVGELTSSFNNMIDHLQLSLTSKENLEKEIVEKEKLEQTLIASEAGLKRAQEIAKVGSWEINLITNTVWGSEEALKIYEIEKTDKEIPLPFIKGMIDSNDRSKVDQALADLLNNSIPFDVTYKIKTVNGNLKYINSIATLKVDDNNNPIKIIGTIHNITKLMLVEETLKYEKNIAQMYLDIVGVMILVLDIEGRVSLINNKGCEILGYDKDEIIGKNWFDNFIPKDVINKETQETHSNIFNGKGKLESNYNNYLITSKKEKRLISWNNVLLYDSNNNIIGVLSSGKDITKEEIYKKKLYNIGYKDTLTKLKNRRYYEENLLKLDIKENYPLTIVMADINGLKLVNDAFGHTSGDKLLIACAETIKNGFREKDLVARIGGDEFVAILPNTDETETEKLISGINRNAAKIKVESIPLSISFGYKTKHLPNEDIQEIYRSAEDSMYRKKLIEIPSMRSGAIETILATLNEKDKNSEAHSKRVSSISGKLASLYGMNMEDISEVKIAGLLHDIGKIIIPLEIINKKGKLTKEEYNTMKSHSEIGFRILNSISNMRGIANIVLNHHERWDGNGYPRGIKEEEIPLKSRIISIADAFDAMTSERTYREKFSYLEALKEILENAGTQFDPNLVKVFESNFEDIINM